MPFASCASRSAALRCRTRAVQRVPPASGATVKITVMNGLRDGSRASIQSIFPALWSKCTKAVAIAIAGGGNNRYMRGVS